MRFEGSSRAMFMHVCHGMYRLRSNLHTSATFKSTDAWASHATILMESAWDKATALACLKKASPGDSNWQLGTRKGTGKKKSTEKSENARGGGRKDMKIRKGFL